MGADKNRTRGILGISFRWPERFRYSNIPNKSECKQSRKAEEGSQWIKGVVICSCIAGLILVINTILAITATVIAYRRPTNQVQFQMAELYSGSCLRSSHWATGFHLLINVLSTILLGSSNYVMQSLGAPSRTDIDQAHAQSRWLDIGTFSLRNFRVMGTRRKILWVLLLVSSTPIHMIYNSVIFPSISILEYGAFVIPDDLSPTESLISGDTDHEAFLSELGSDATDVQAQIFNGTFTNTTLEDCLAKYNMELNTNYGTLIFMTDRQHLLNTSSLKLRPYNTTGSKYKYSEQVAVLLIDGTMAPCHWSYRVWNYSVPDFVHEPYHGDISSFNFRDNEYLALGANSDITQRDILTLANYTDVYNPSHGALREYLDTPSHWMNSSWAAGITFELIDGDDNTDGILHENFARKVPPSSHCLFAEEGQRCQLFFSPLVAVVVIICNITKVACMLLTARVKRRDLMLTVGDALGSFITRPDLTTRGRCFLSHAEMTKGPQAWNLPAISFRRSKGHILQQRARGPTSHLLHNLSATSTPENSEIYPSLLPRRKRWYQAASWKHWTTVLFFFMSCIATVIYLLVVVLYIDSPFGSAMDLGFGTTTGVTMLRYSLKSPVSPMFLANTPQIILSTLYFLTNGILTCMLVAAEWDKYARNRRPLRVSWPRGQQRSTYYLSVPYRYSIPLLVLSTTLHWLLSQSFFFVHVKMYSTDGTEDEERSARGCCYSPMAMFIAFWVGVLALGLLLGVGARRFKSHMPVASHCSAAISAACHPPDEDEGAALKPVMWGEIPRGEETEVTTESENGYTGAAGDNLEYAHCSFTSLDVVTPSLVRLYC